ncbi:MAG: choice-of-anchor tandem repeat GloVer-containing protein [Flavobacterium sp.]
MQKLCSLIILTVFSLQLHAQKEIWGTVSDGGQYNYGYIFRCDSIGDNLTVMHHFKGYDGQAPGTLLQINNKLYGVTTYGGSGFNPQVYTQGGVLFEYDMSTLTYKVLKNFLTSNTDIIGVTPPGHGESSLTEAKPGAIYGTLRLGYGHNIFSYDTNTGAITSALLMPQFNGGAMNTPQGMTLNGALFKAADGLLYGATYERSTCPIGQPIGGTIVKINPANNTITLPYIMPCSSVEQGFLYKSEFAEVGTDLYSVTHEGGLHSKGTIYKFNRVANAYTKLYDFTGGLQGSEPKPMVRAANGKLYGTASGGLAQNSLPAGGGFIYEFDPASATYTKKYDFPHENGWIMAVGIYPWKMIKGHNSKLYGTTQVGVYEYDPATNTALPKGRYSSDFFWGTAFPTITAVCRKPTYVQRPFSSFLVCPGAPFTYDLQSSNTTAAVWEYNGQIAPGYNSTHLNVPNWDAGNGTWQATLTNECGQTVTQEIVVMTNPQPTVIQNGGKLQSTVGAAHYQWNDCTANIALPDSDSVEFTPQTSGNYSVTITTGTCSITSPCFNYTALGSEEFIATPNIVIAPNPVTDVLHIRNITGEITGGIYSVLGQKVVAVTSAETNVSGLRAGTYFVVIETSAGTFRSKFIRQ